MVTIRVKGSDWELPDGTTIRVVNLAEQGMFVSLRDLVSYLSSKDDPLPRKAVTDLLVELMKP